MMPKGTKFQIRRGADLADQAHKCRQRLQHCWRADARAKLEEEWEDWLAFAARERGRRIEAFRASPIRRVAEEARWGRPLLQRAGSSASR